MPKHEAQGLRLRAAIERSGMARSELAQRAGISLPYIARMLAGDRSGADHVAALAKLLGVHERWLRFGDDDVKPDWALNAESLRLLSKTTEYVKTAHGAQPARSDVIVQVLQDLLVEQRRIRHALERLAGIEDPEAPQAGRRHFKVPPRPERAPT